MEAIRIHRVGTITTGCTLIAAGVLFVIHTFLNIISYEMIFRLWPIILIGLGFEVLAANFSKERIVYDKAGVVLLFLVVFSQWAWPAQISALSMRRAEYLPGDNVFLTEWKY